MYDFKKKTEMLPCFAAIAGARGASDARDQTGRSAATRHAIAGSHFHDKGVLNIQLEGSFQAGPPTGRLLTRIRAFIKMLQP